MKTQIYLKILFAFILLAPLTQVVGQESDNIHVHDPVMIKSGDTYYLFCTGWGISVFSSKDMKTWQKEAPVFKKPPEWTQTVVPGFEGHIWAPDVSYYNGRFYLYYSVSAFAKNTSAIGLATNITLDPKDPDFNWEDQGIIIQSVPNRDLWNAIDPNLTIDSLGYPWLSFGSFWEGLKLVKLVPNRDAIAQPQQWFTIAKRKRSDFIPDTDPGDAAIEAPFIFKKNGYFYLFASWDYCCRGANSTYKMVVGRSKTIQGPYLDKAGKSMADGGGTIVLEGNEFWSGVGHNSAYTFDDKDYLIFHAYDAQDGGSPKLKIAPINWDKEDWPIVDSEVLRNPKK